MTADCLSVYRCHQSKRQQTDNRATVYVVYIRPVFKGMGINPRNGDLKVLAQIQHVYTLSTSKNIATRNVSWPQNIPKMRLRPEFRSGPRWVSSQRSTRPLAELGEGRERERRGREEPANQKCGYSLGLYCFSWFFFFDNFKFKFEFSTVARMGVQLQVYSQISLRHDNVKRTDPLAVTINSSLCSLPSPRCACVCVCGTVPAAIIDHLSSDDVTVQEGDTVVLVCNVTGVPTPDVTWFRRPASSAPTDRERTSY